MQYSSEYEQYKRLSRIQTIISEKEKKELEEENRSVNSALIISLS